MARQRFRNNRRVMTERFLETVSGLGKPHMYCIVARLCFPCPSSCFSVSKPSLRSCDTASAPLASKIEMAPKWKASSSSAAVIHPIDPNSQLPFAGNHMSVVSEFDLLISCPLEFFLRRSSVLGGFAMGSLFQQRTPTNPLFMFLFFSAVLLFQFPPFSTVFLISIT
jgi:hypothetical protein